MLRLPRVSLTRIVILGAALVVGYLLFTAAEDFLLSQSLEREERQLRQDIAELRQEEQELQAIREYLLTDEYIQGVARRVLGLVQPDETLVIVSSPTQPTPTPEGSIDEDARWWELLYGQ